MVDSGTRTTVTRAGAPRALAQRLVRVLTAPLVGRSIALPADLVSRYPELAQARWRRGGLPTRIGGWCLGRAQVAGITLGRTIWLSTDVALAPELLLHELRHVHQFAADRAFPLRYVWRSFRYGYVGNPYELDARAFAERRLGGGPPTV